MSQTPSRAAQSQLMSLLTAKWLPPIVGVLAELRVADHLTDGPKTPQALAGAMGAHPTALRRALRAAASLGVFAERHIAQSVPGPSDSGQLADRRVERVSTEGDVDHG